MIEIRKVSPRIGAEIQVSIRNRTPLLVGLVVVKSQTPARYLLPAATRGSSNTRVVGRSCMVGMALSVRRLRSW